MTGSASFVVFRFSCMLALLAVLPAVSAKTKITKFADNPISFQELKKHSTWPPPQPFLTPKGEMFLEDTPVAVALTLLLIMGVPFMYADVCEFAEDEDAKDHDASPRSSGNGKRSSRRHFTLCVVVAVLAVLASLPVRELAGESDAAAQDEIYAIGEAALQLLDPGRAGMPSLHAHIASDRAVAAFLACLTMIGWLVGSYDLQEMEAEEKHKSVMKKVTEDNSWQFKDARDSLPALPMALQLAFNATAAGNLCMCALLVQRRWAQVGTAALSLEMELASDDVTLLFLGFFALLGLAAMCADFRTFAKEEEQEAKKVTSSNSRSSKEADKQMSWSQCLTRHWRSVSCAVLLLSVFVAAAASLNDSAM